MLTTSTVENHSLPEIKLLLLIYLLVGGYSLQRQGKVLVKPPPVILATVSNFMMQFLTDPFRHSGIFSRFCIIGSGRYCSAAGQSQDFHKLLLHLAQ